MITSTELPNIITANDQGKPTAPKSIVPNARVARAIYNRFRSAHVERTILYSEIEGLIAGNPPYDPEELHTYKLDHIANFNNFDARSMFEKAALAYWNLLNSAQTLIKFEFIDPLTGKTSTEPQLLMWAQVMARNWDLEVRRWPSFVTNCNTLFGQLVKFGLSPAVWHDERDWRWEVIQLQRFFVADQASTDIEKLTAVCVESDHTLQYLYEVYEDLKEKKKNKSKKSKKATTPKEESDDSAYSFKKEDSSSSQEGSDGEERDKDDEPEENEEQEFWCIEELEKVLLHYGRNMATAGGAGTTISASWDIMEMQRSVQNGDSSMDALYTDTIRLVSLFFKEYDGKITHIIFDKADTTTEIIFRSEGQYEDFQQMVVVLTSSPAEFTLHSNIGVGHKLFSPCQATMRMDCSIVDLAQWSSTPIIQSPPNGGQNLEAIKFYPGVPTNIGMATFQPNNLGANINQLVGAASYLSSKLQNNIANSGDDPEIPDKSQGSISPTQARMQSFKEFGVLKHNIAHTYTQVDLIYRNMVAKMLHCKEGYPGHDAAKRWKDRCIAAGVPETLFDVSNKGRLDQFGLPANLSCKATRVAGDGSTVALIMALEALDKVASGFGAREAKEYRRQWILATMGPDYVPAFLQDSGDEDETAGGASLAAVENAVMQLGQTPLFSPDNDQRGHIAQHMALGKHVIDQIQQQQMSPVDADPIFQMLIPHMQQHIEFISRDQFAQTFTEGITKPWYQLKAYADLNRKNAARMYQAEIKKKQEAEAQQQQAMSEEQLKQMQVQGDEQRRNLKAQGQEKRAQFAFQNKASIATQKLQSDTALKAKKLDMDAEARRSEIEKDATLREHEIDINAQLKNKETNLSHSNERAKIDLDHQNKTQETDNSNDQEQRKIHLESAQERLEAMSLPDLRKLLRSINGSTPAPYDIERNTD